MKIWWKESSGRFSSAGSGVLDILSPHNCFYLRKCSTPRCVLGGAGYLYLGLTPLCMPVHQQKQEVATEQGEVSRSKLSRPILSLVCFMLFLYYTCSGAVERVFQSMATTWTEGCKKC